MRQDRQGSNPGVIGNPILTTGTALPNFLANPAPTIMQNIYFLRDNQQAGPFSEKDIRAQLASGALSGDTMVWWEGLPEWKPLLQTPLASAVGSGTPALTSLPTPPPIVGAAAGAPTTSGLAITSLVLGCVSLIFSPLGLAAVITGHIARSQIRRNPNIGGKGMALAGLILGYICIFLFIAIVAISVLIALGNQVKQVEIQKAQTEQSNNDTSPAPAPAPTPAPSQ